jgi:hypothetical protein
MRGCKATQGLQIVHPKSLTRSNVGKPFKTKESAGVIYEELPGGLCPQRGNHHRDGCLKTATN